MVRWVRITKNQYFGFSLTGLWLRNYVLVSFSILFFFIHTIHVFCNLYLI